MPRTPGLGENNLQTARKDLVTRSDLGKPEQRNVLRAPSLVSRRWFDPEFWDESPPGWLEQRPRWLWRAGGPGSAAQGLLCAPHSLATSENAHFPRFVPYHLLSLLAFAVPFPGLAERRGGGGRVRGSGVASAVTLSHKGERHLRAGQGRLLRDGVTGGGCGKRELLLQGESPRSGRVGGFGVVGKGGMEWPIPSPVSLHNAVTCPLPRAWVALKGCHAGTCHRNQLGHSPAQLVMRSGLICISNYFGELGGALS